MVWFEIIKKQSFNFIIEGLKPILDDEAKRALRLTKPNFSATWRNQKRLKYNEGSFTIDLVIDIDRTNFDMIYKSADIHFAKGSGVNFSFLLKKESSINGDGEWEILFDSQEDSVESYGINEELQRKILSDIEKMRPLQLIHERIGGE
tara:strand:+ start:577 stop:1020 length:444 start_codon:yes stop_codon:yes gene_type:complete